MLGCSRTFPQGICVFLAALRLSEAEDSLPVPRCPPLSPACFFCRLLNSLPPSYLPYPHLRPSTAPYLKHISWASVELLSTGEEQTNPASDNLQWYPAFASASGVCDSRGREKEAFLLPERKGVIPGAPRELLSLPPAARAGHYLDFPAGRMDTGSVCTSASDILLEPRPLKNPPRDCLFSAFL